MKFSDDIGTTRRVRWFFTDRLDFPQYPIAFCSSQWDDIKTGTPDCVGEDQGSRKWVDGSKPAWVKESETPCGTPEQWAGEISLAEFEATRPNCKPKRRGAYADSYSDAWDVFHP